MTFQIQNQRLFVALLILGAGAGLSPLMSLDAAPFSWQVFAGAYTTDADLEISKDDGETEVLVGATVTYTIQVTNAGPDDVVGAQVTDSFPSPDLAGCTWTCSGTGAASCATMGSGDLNESVDIPALESVTFLATCTVQASANGSTLMNTASVAVPVGATDPDPFDNTASDTNTMATPVELMSFAID